MKDYGGALKKLRKHFGYTQQQLAEKLSVSYQTVSKWETGTNQMDLDTARAMCDVLGVSLDAFIKIADGAEVSSALTPAQPQPIEQPEYKPEQPVKQPAPAPAQPAVQPTAQHVVPNATAQPIKEESGAAHKPIEKVPLIIAISLLAVIIAFIIATIAVFAPRRSSGLGDYLGGNGKSVTVSYNLNGGSGSMASEQFKNGVVTLPYCSANRKGYKFNGWSYDGKVYEAYDKIKDVADSDITVTATWKPITYTISFGGFVGTGNMASIKAEYDKKVKLPKSNFTLAGKPMTYWYVDLNERYDDEDTVINLSDRDGAVVSLLPSYDPLSIYIKLDGDGGFGGENNIRSYSDNPAVVENFGWNKYGYNLVGWKCGDKTFSPGEYFDFNTYRYNSYTATAVWEFDEPYIFSVEYHCNMPYCEMDGTVIDEYTAYDGDGYVLRNPCEGTHVGYELDCISAQGADYRLGGKIATHDFKGKNIEATVKYKPIEYDTVIQYQSEEFGEMVYIHSLKWKYDTDISKWVEDTVMGYYGMHDEGYHIVDYKIYLNGTEYTGDMRKVTTDKSDKIVVEFTQELNSYTLVYYNGESITVTLGYDEEYTLQNMAESEKSDMVGYIFAGWEIKGTIYKEGETVSKLAYRHLEEVDSMMKWQPITFTVQFDCNGGLGNMDAVTLEYTSHYNLPESSFRKDGYVFLGWECDGKIYGVDASLYQFTAENGKVIMFKAVWGVEYVGDGTYDSPYQIETYEQLYNLRWFIDLGENSGMYYSLGKDIDCAGKPLYPISYFSGILNGNGHVIRNADLKQEFGRVGLFGYISGGVYNGNVYDLGMDGYTVNVQAVDGDLMVAPIAAAAKHAQFGRVWASGSITVAVDSDRQNYIGGLVGALYYSSIVDCFSVGSINVAYGEKCTSDKTVIGGLAGYAGDYSLTSEIETSYADMQITATAAGQNGSASVGGIVGYKYYNLSLHNVFVAGGITAGGEVASPICANYKYNSYFIYVCDDYALTVGGETKSITDATTLRANLRSAEWLGSNLGFDFGDDGEWQGSGWGFPTLRGFAVQPSYTGGNA